MLEPDGKWVVALQIGIRGFANMAFKCGARDAVHKLIEASPAFGSRSAWQRIAACIGD